MNKKMQLYNRLHKLNTAQIITLGFAGVIILGGITSVAAVLYGTRIPHIFYRCHVYRNHKYMCNRACDSCYGNSLDSGRQDYYSCPDPDRRCGTDFPGQYYFYKSEKENIAEEPACYPGVL